MFRTFNSLLSVPHDCIEFVAFISFFALLSYSAVSQLVAASAESIVFSCVAIPLKVQSLWMLFTPVWPKVPADTSGVRCRVCCYVSKENISDKLSHISNFKGKKANYEKKQKNVIQPNSLTPTFFF